MTRRKSTPAPRRPRRRKRPARKFINQPKAMAFAESLADPVVAAMLMDAYGALIFKVAPTKVDGQFDLLFFFKVLEAFLRDRDRVARMCRGEFDTW